jgi:hypothetical protein
LLWNACNNWINNYVNRLFVCSTAEDWSVWFWLILQEADGRIGFVARPWISIVGCEHRHEIPPSFLITASSLSKHTQAKDTPAIWATYLADYLAVVWML